MLHQFFTTNNYHHTHSPGFLQVDVTEYMFKLALLQRKYDQVIGMIKGSNLCGSAIIRCVCRMYVLWIACVHGCAHA
jgi:hypothetical protein